MPSAGTLTGKATIMARKDVAGYASVDLDQIINNDLEWFLDTLADRIGQPLLMDIHYRVVGHDRDTLLFLVRGEVDDA